MKKELDQITHSESPAGRPAGCHATATPPHTWIHVKMHGPLDVHVPSNYAEARVSKVGGFRPDWTLSLSLLLVDVSMRERERVNEIVRERETFTGHSTKKIVRMLKVGVGMMCRAENEFVSTILPSYLPTYLPMRVFVCTYIGMSAREM